MREFLFGLECVIFLAGTIALARREKMFGVYYFALWVYVVFSQIGYFYYPEFSATLNAYFGDEISNEVTLFVICSAVSLFLFLRFCAGSVIRAGAKMTALIALKEARAASRAQSIAVFALSCALALQVIALIVNYSQISWENAQMDDVFTATPLVGILILLVKASVGTNIAMYANMRETGFRNLPFAVKALTSVSLPAFMVFTFKLGNRADSVSLLLGLTIYELNKISFGWRHFWRLLVVALCLLVYLNTVEAIRASNTPSDVDLAASIIAKDYFAGAHILFAAIYYDMVTPLRVISSNVSNALMGLGQPYLQADIMDQFAPGVATRGASYGFYPFTEGYLVAGFAGFLYNGIVLGTCLAAWRSLATTNSDRFNKFLLAILGSMSIVLVRGQSSYFVKYLYTFVLPGTLVYLSLSRQRISAAFVIGSLSTRARERDADYLRP